MKHEDIVNAAKKAVQTHFQCNGKYPCEERDYCEFCNGHNSAFDCKEDCGADNFNEGFIAGANWTLKNQWISVDEKLPEDGDDVFVITPFDGHKAYYDGHDNEFYETSTDYTINNVIWWMKIPDSILDF